MSRKGLLIKILFTLLLLPASVYLARAGIADFLRLEPCAYLEAVKNGKERLVPARLMVARERLLLARSWDAGNPLIPEYLGQIAVIRAQLISLSPALQGDFFREAIADFDEAIALRPNSAILWADRVTAGSALLEANARAVRDAQLVEAEMPLLSFAFRRACELGPWEPEALSQLMRVGALRHQEFSPEMREVVEAAIVRARKLGLKV